MSELYPTELKLSPEGQLSIAWSDGAVQEITLRELRSECPCARCKAERLKPPKPASIFPTIQSSQARPLEIDRMVPVGNYAYSIEFSDGHHSGIYSFEFLRQLGKPSSQGE